MFRQNNHYCINMGEIIMKRKKKTYAEKHFNFLPSAEELSNAFVRENADLWETLRNPPEFPDNFAKLDYSRQVALVDLLSGVMRNKIVMSPAKMQEKLLDLSADCLEMIGWMCSSYYDAGNIYYPLSDDEKKLVRMECYGSIDIRQDHELSSCYKFFRKEKNRGKFRLKDYDLSQSPMWRVFNQFESFRSIAPNVRRYMYKNGINPDALKVMSVNDFCDVIHKSFAKTPESMKALFLKTGYKKRFVKSFMKERGKELYAKLLKDGMDERKVASLCRRMAKDGCCDIPSLIITEINFTPRIIKDLQRTPYFNENFKVGDPIPEELMYQMFQDDKENILLARDENGLPLNKDDMPRFEVHHKNAVKFANDDDYLSKVNYPTNLVLVEHEMHRAYFHGFDDTDEVAKGNEQYFSRINMWDANIALMIGFNYNICCRWEKNVAFRKRAEKDKQNVVNYYEMQLQRLGNIPEIAKQYGIDYSKTDLGNERRNLIGLLQDKINVSAEDVQIFTDWVAPDAKTKKSINKATGQKIKLTKNNKGNEL